jgi:hypothetical protein
MPKKMSCYIFFRIVNIPHCLTHWGKETFLAIDGKCELSGMLAAKAASEFVG